MLNQLMNDGNFKQQLLKAHTAANNDSVTNNTSDLSQWLQYWDDAESVPGNLRKLEHWLQRARLQQS